MHSSPRITSLWSRLHADLLRSSERLRFHWEFRARCERHELLVAYADPAALLDALAGSGGDPAHKNAILGALVRIAQKERSREHTARVVLVLALWPGLDAMRRRLLRHFRDDPDRLAAEIFERLITGIARLNLKRVKRIAATLIRNVERDIRRMLSREWRRETACTEFAQIVSVHDRARWSRGDLSAGDVMNSNRDLRAVVGRDARLVSLVAIDGYTQAEAGDITGVGHDAARKRYQRALRKLRQQFGV